MEASRGDKTICLPFQSEEHYFRCMDDRRLFRAWLEELHGQHPELFPSHFGKGFSLDDRRFSERAQMWIRRIELHADKQKFSVRPSFVMPYMVALTEEVEHGLYLRHWGVPFDALAHVFGRSPMFWYRAELSLGRSSLVGTSVKAPEHLPEHLVADEKHTRLVGKKVFVPTVAAGGCILGATVTESADAPALEAAYGEFSQEARQLSPSYAPKSVGTDGWEGTQKAFRSLFKGIAVILCFLHSVLKISDRCRRDPARADVLTKTWDVYKAASRTQMSERIEHLRTWAVGHLASKTLLLKTVLKLCSKRERFLEAFDHPGAHRTSNGVDRLINHLDRRLFMMRKLHGVVDSARLAVRSIALQWNFHPYGPRLRTDEPERRSPFRDLNGFEYHHNWLHNLLIAASMGGRRR
jgi:hypothetical protein